MKKVWRQFCRFSAVGIVSFLIDCGLLFALIESFEMHYLWSSMLSFSAATLFNYVYSMRYVFECGSEKSRTGQFSVFLLLSICGLLLNSIFMKIFVEHMELYYMFAKICATFLVSLWNFGSRKMFLEENTREKILRRRKELLQRL
ncbi:MAG: GtrA family protein [Lachnospiraceae bacterium]|nr:GtrA family protein [Lachnospiraceae bacterium]